MSEVAPRRYSGVRVRFAEFVSRVRRLSTGLGVGGHEVMILCCMCFREVPGGSVEFREVPGGSVEFREVPGGSAGLREVPRESGRFREVQ